MKNAKNKYLNRVKHDKKLILNSQIMRLSMIIK